MNMTALPAKERQSESTFLREWILSSVMSTVKEHVSLPIWPAVPNFVPPLVKLHGHVPFNSRTLLNRRHFLKITNFHRIENFTVFASGRDNNCRILVEFTPQCVSKFERLNSIRITEKTVNTIFLIGAAALKYLPVNEAWAQWSLSIPLDPNIPVVPVLVVEQCEVFDLDQVEVRPSFDYLYRLGPFEKLFTEV
ncbi:LAQU0S04e04764g1_1 [Lachancea quebecensis]|uniref:Telomere replication protein EST3 n=1 Tax=Lachancea quebecensis TaxID=1654605 RepID=A0A0N7MLD2_9SACH|nr:LAQU0S04e04764g1_1 [Lachancea quebecensis]